MFTLLKFILHLELHAKLQEQFQRRYPNIHLNKVAVSRVFTHLRQEMCLTRKNWTALSVLTTEKFEDVEQSPRTSVRKLALQLQMSNSSA
jgi:hypothetical protein